MLNNPSECQAYRRYSDRLECPFNNLYSKGLGAVVVCNIRMVILHLMCIIEIRSLTYLAVCYCSQEGIARKFNQLRG